MFYDMIIVCLESCDGMIKVCLQVWLYSMGIVWFYDMPEVWF